MFKIILQLHAHKKGTGSSHNGRDSNSQLVRQHGTRFHIGKNVGMGRDYTIYAKIAGKVRFGRHGRTERIISIEPVEEAKEA